MPLRLRPADIMGRRKKHRMVFPPGKPQNPDPGPSAQQILAQAEQSLVARAFSGPLPPPEDLAKYNQILPGLAGRIVAMAENQSQHRQALEKMVVESRLGFERRGQVFALVLGLVLAVGSIGLIGMGRSVEGLAAIIAELIALTAAFVFGRRRQEKEVTEQLQALAHTEVSK